MGIEYTINTYKNVMWTTFLLAQFRNNTSNSGGCRPTLKFFCHKTFSYIKYEICSSVGRSFHKIIIVRTVRFVFNRGLNEVNAGYEYYAEDIVE
jgi:hypothetical protein